jgi:hypothetical protein
LLALAVCLWLAAALVLSFVLQPIRRACVLEEQSLWTSIRLGVRLTIRHFKEMGLLWLVWMGVRLLWALVGMVVVILLLPVLFVTFLIGLVAGGVLAVLVAGLAHLSWNGTTAWLMGALAGLPAFILVMVSPVFFVSGLVEIYKSCIWTLAYHELKAMKVTAQAPVPQLQGLPASGPAD